MDQGINIIVVSRSAEVKNPMLPCGIVTFVLYCTQLAWPSSTGSRLDFPSWEAGQGSVIDAHSWEQLTRQGRERILRLGAHELCAQTQHLELAPPLCNPAIESSCATKKTTRDSLMTSRLLSLVRKHSPDPSSSTSTSISHTPFIETGDDTHPTSQGKEKRRRHHLHLSSLLFAFAASVTLVLFITIAQINKSHIDALHQSSLPFPAPVPNNVQHADQRFCICSPVTLNTHL